MARARLSSMSHDSAILAAAHKSRFTGMHGLEVAVAVAVALDFGVDGMLRLAMLAHILSMNLSE